MKKKYWLISGFFALVVIFGFTTNLKDINREIVKHAAELIGLEFTSSEIDSMLPSLERKRIIYEELRENEIPNSLIPAIEFNPIPDAFKMPTRQTLIKYKPIEGKVKLPSNKNDLAFYSIRELGELIKSRQISCVDLTQFFIDRLKKHDKTLHCVISYTEQRALERAKWADKEIVAGRYRGELHGIPFGVKDLFASKDAKTTWGATPYKNQQFENDATVIGKLERSGAILVAKLSLGALAWGDVWFDGKTRNPWSPSEGSSGSSAGSAAAVSAGLLPFAIGTETLGSIVSPSTVCGVTGFRPTYGTISRKGAMALSWSMDKVGPIARNAEDCAIVFSALRGDYGLDKSALKAPFNYNTDKKLTKLKIGYVKSDFERDYAFRYNDSLSLVALQEMGYELVPMELPKVPNISFILEAEAAAAFDHLTRSNQDDLMVRQIQNAWPNVFRQARFIPAVEYINANRLRKQLIEDMHQTMQSVHFYVHPSWASSSLTLTNLTGHPSVTVPNGFSEKDTPTSISFTGRLFDDGRLLQFIHLFQEHTGFHLEQPEKYRE